jgi:membrane associated rhomboid family serine protease
MLYFPPIDFRRTPFTLILAATALGLTVMCELDQAAKENYSDLMAIWAQIWMGEVWRPLTTTILHGNLLHALLNIYWLLIFGTALESWIGSYRLCGMVLLFAYVSSLADYTLAPLIVGRVTYGVGLSGVMYGLFGVFWVGSRYRSHYAAVCPPQVVQLLVGWFFLCIALTAIDALRVANIAHAAGLGMGLLMGQAMFDVRRRWQWVSVLSVVSIQVLATLVFCPWHPHFRIVRAAGEWWAQRWF